MIQTIEHPLLDSPLTGFTLTLWGFLLVDSITYQFPDGYPSTLYSDLFIPNRTVVYEYIAIIRGELKQIWSD